MALSCISFFSGDELGLSSTAVAALVGVVVVFAVDAAAVVVVVGVIVIVVVVNEAVEFVTVFPSLPPFFPLSSVFPVTPTVDVVSGAEHLSFFSSALDFVACSSVLSPSSSTLHVAGAEEEAGVLRELRPRVGGVDVDDTSSITKSTVSPSPPSPAAPPLAFTVGGALLAPGGVFLTAAAAVADFGEEAVPALTVEEEEDVADSDLLAGPFFSSRGCCSSGCPCLGPLLSSTGAGTGSEEQERLVIARIFGGEGRKSTNSST